MEYYDLLLPLAMILLFSKLLAKGCHKLNLPAVVGFLLTGLLLSAVTYIPGQTVFSPDVLEGLGFLAKIGVVLIMFETGLDTDIKQIRDVGVSAVTVTVAGVVLPMALGFLTAVFFHGGFEALTHDSLVACLFYGTILTATSISVSVATLREIGKQNTKVGNIIVTAAVLDDIIGVVVLSFVIAMKNTVGATSLAPLYTIGKIILFFLIAVPLGVLLNKLFAYLDNRYPHHRLIPIFSLAVCFLFAYASEKFFGVADITGAYVAGVALARNPDRGYIERRSDIMSYMIFTPVFFANIGLTIKFAGIGASMIFFGVCFIAAGIFGKLFGCGLTARAFGYSRRESLRIGVGMMARAEVALVCAQKGVENGIIDSSIMPFILILIICTGLITPITLRMTYKKEDMQNRA